MDEPLRNSGCRCSGFTLIEIVVTLIVLGIVSAVVAPVIVATFDAYFTGRDVAQTDWQARVAIERMTRELRAIRSPADLVVNSATDISFVDTDGNTIRYCAGGVGACPGAAGDLMRNAQPLAVGIGGLAFSLLTRTAASTGSPAAAYYVSASFTATQSSVSKSYAFTVSPRNFP